MKKCHETLYAQQVIEVLRVEQPAVGLHASQDTVGYLLIYRPLELCLYRKLLTAYAYNFGLDAILCRSELDEEPSYRVVGRVGHQYSHQ